MHGILVFVHIIAASVWTGGHLILALSVLPKALKDKSLSELSRFESSFEKIGVPALIIQVITGLWMAADFVPQASQWFDVTNPMARLIAVKIILLSLTVAFALDARLRIIPKLTVDRLPELAWHIIPVTLISVLFVLVGVSFRTGGGFIKNLGAT